MYEDILTICKYQVVELYHTYNKLDKQNELEVLVKSKSKVMSKKNSNLATSRA